MIRFHIQRVLASRVTAVVATVCGLVAGYWMGYALAIQVAENWLDQSTKLMAAQDDASFTEARDLLMLLKASTSSYCSDQEISNFRDLLFRSEYLRDVGRIRDGKIDCSATVGRPDHAIGHFKPNSHQEDGIIGYSNLVPVRDDTLKRAGLQWGTAYVVFGPHLPASLGPIPMQLAVNMKDEAYGQSDTDPGGATRSVRANPSTVLTARHGDTLSSTRCSALHFNCVTASTTVSKALYCEAGIVSACTVAGGMLGFLSGMAFLFAFRRSRDMCQQLRRAVERDKVTVVFQPIVDLATRRIVGAESLARWTDEGDNEVSPEVFVKIAEEHGFVGDFTRNMVRRSLRALSDTLRSRPDFRLSINVAAADLSDPRFLPMLEDTLMRERVQPQSVAIEITERSNLASESAMETIRTLRLRGHSVHIDDFGTGHSNLDKLLYLFADTIKIDKAFTKLIGTDSVTVSILPQILAMAKSLNLEVVVEGIELDRQADYFPEMKQKMYGQGWLFGRPVTVEQFQELLAQEQPKPVCIAEPDSAWAAANACTLHLVERHTA